MALFRRRKSKAGAAGPLGAGEITARNFPTDGYFVPVEDEEMREYEAYSLNLFEESRSLGTIGRASRATRADLRVAAGPTQEDQDNIPYLQEAWQWAASTCARLRLKPGDSRYGVVLDCLTRMRAAALIAKRNDVWPDTASKVAGLDFNWILAEHNAEPRDVWPKLEKIENTIEADCRGEDWDEVVWGDIDPFDPARKLVIWEEDCDGCGNCAEAYPDLFALKSNGKATAIDPKAPRDPEKEPGCFEVMNLCSPMAIVLDTRGTIDGFTKESGRPLPGQMKRAE